MYACNGTEVLTYRYRYLRETIATSYTHVSMSQYPPRKCRRAAARSKRSSRFALRAPPPRGHRKARVVLVSHPARVACRSLDSNQTWDAEPTP